MRKLMTLIGAATLLVGMIAAPAVADHDDPILHQLEEAISEAQDLVDDLTVLVGELETELIAAEAALMLAREDYEAQVIVVAGLQAEYDAAEAALSAAEDMLADLEAQYAACNPATSGPNNGNQCRGQLNGPIADAEAQVEADQEAYDAALEALEVATEELATLGGIVETKQTAVDDLEDDIAAKKAELETAEEDLAAAVLARDEYLASLESPPRHEGCNGVEQAVAQVTSKGNGKGKAAVVLTAKAVDWNCN
jgi:chromosome segregation ATPase